MLVISCAGRTRIVPKFDKAFLPFLLAGCFFYCTGVLTGFEAFIAVVFARVTRDSSFFDCSAEFWVDQAMVY